MQLDYVLYRFDTTNDGLLYTASSDGTISSTDLDTGIGSSLLNLNPNGWNVSFHCFLVKLMLLYILFAFYIFYCS